MRRRAVILVSVLSAAATVAGVVGLAVASTRVSSESAVSQAPTKRVLDARDQYQLVEEMVEARKSEDLLPALDKVRGAWQGRRFAWEVALLPALCQSAGACVAMPFDHKKYPDRKIVQGWLPRLAMDEATHAKLLADCESHARCVFTFEGRLQRFVFNPEDPTSLQFSDLTITSTRAATAEESWIKKERKRLDPRVVGLRTKWRVGGQSR